MRTSWNFHSAGQLTFGTGAVDQIAPWLTRRRLSRVFLVADTTLVSLGMTDRVSSGMREAGVQVEVFDGGEPEPSVKAAVSAIEAARAFKPEAILGLGGGSNMDLAKVAAVVLGHGGQPQDYFGFDSVPGPVLPLICVPTTAGTGSEVSSAAVLTDTDNQIKVSTLSNYLRPALAVVDPRLTYSCPPKVTADSGIDALTHAIEAFTAVDFDQMLLPEGEATAYQGRYPLGECLAEKAISLLGRFLRRAVHSGDDQQAREQVALAATLAGLAFSNCGVALVHALEYPIGGALHCSHGAGNGLLLPYVMRYNLPVRTEALARVAELLGEEVQGMAPHEAAEQAIRAVERLRRDIGIPERLRQLGGSADDLPQFAAKAFSIKRLMWINPREPKEADLLEILRQAW